MQLSMKEIFIENPLSVIDPTNNDYDYNYIKWQWNVKYIQ